MEMSGEQRESSDSESATIAGYCLPRVCLNVLRVCANDKLFSCFSQFEVVCGSVIHRSMVWEASMQKEPAEAFVTGRKSILSA